MATAFGYYGEYENREDNYADQVFNAAYQSAMAGVLRKDALKGVTHSYQSFVIAAYRCWAEDQEDVEAGLHFEEADVAKFAYDTGLNGVDVDIMLKSIARRRCELAIAEHKNGLRARLAETPEDTLKREVKTELEALGYTHVAIKQVDAGLTLSPQFSVTCWNPKRKEPVFICNEPMSHVKPQVAKWIALEKSRREQFEKMREEMLH